MILLLVVLLPGRLELVAAAWGMLALGDGAAGLLGPRIGGPALPWNARKSWAGLGAFTAVAFPSAVFLIRWTQGGGASGVGGAFGGSSTWLLFGCFAAALAAGVAESLDSEVDDNIRVPMAGVGALLVAAAIDPGVHSAWTTALQPPFPGLLLLLVPAAAAWGVKAVSPSGALGGWVLVAGLYMFSGWPAVFAFGAFFVVGTGATRLGGRRKRDLGVAQEDGGRRGASHAAANAGAGLLFAFLTAFGGAPELFSLAMAASFATAAFDTASSEVGQAFGRHHVLVTSFRRVPPGTEGAVSIEGTLGGLAGGGRGRGHGARDGARGRARCSVRARGGRGRRDGGIRGGGMAPPTGPGGQRASQLRCDSGRRGVRGGVEPRAGLIGRGGGNREPEWVNRPLSCGEAEPAGDAQVPGGPFTPRLRGVAPSKRATSPGALDYQPRGYVTSCQCDRQRVRALR